MAMTPWLSRAEFDQYIGGIPESFSTEKLEAILSETIEGWLADQIGVENVAAYRILLAGALAGAPVPVVLTTEQTAVTLLIRQFLTYAVWSVHVLKSNAIVTETGIVTKRTDESEPISSAQRTELSKYYRGLAERKALALTRLVVTTNNCAASTAGSGRPLIRKAQPKSPSRLGN